MTPGSVATDSIRAFASGQSAQPWAVNSSMTTGSGGAAARTARADDGWATDPAATRAAAKAATGMIQPLVRMPQRLTTPGEIAPLIFA
jgi:hypothetical protein